MSEYDPLPCVEEGGRVGGRPRKLLTGGRVALARQLVEDPNHSIDAICSTLGISLNGIQRGKKDVEAL